MRMLARNVSVVALAATLAACGLLGGGKAPPYLYTLTPQAADPGAVTRTSTAGQAITIGVPVIAKELRTVRVPAQITPTVVQYVTDLQWVDTPDKLFQNLVEETVRRSTSRVVLSPGQSGLDPGLVLNGQLQRFGYDAPTGQVVVVFDGALSTPGGAQVETRRFTASAPADGTGPSVGPALNSAANQVAAEIARWIGR